MFRCVDIPHIFNHSPVGGPWSCSQLLAIVTNAAMNTHVQVLVWTYIFSSPGYLLRNRVAGSYGNSVTNIVRTCQTLSQGGRPISHFPSAVGEFQLLLLFTSTWPVQSFYQSHSSRCEELGFYPADDRELINNVKVRIDGPRRAGCLANT